MLPVEQKLAESMKLKLSGIDARVKGRRKHWVGEICRILRVADLEFISC